MPGRVRATRPAGRQGERWWRRVLAERDNRVPARCTTSEGCRINPPSPLRCVRPTPVPSVLEILGHTGEVTPVPQHAQDAGRSIGLVRGEPRSAGREVPEHREPLDVLQVGAGAVSGVLVGSSVLHPSGCLLHQLPPTGPEQPIDLTERDTPVVIVGRAQSDATGVLVPQAVGTARSRPRFDLGFGWGEHVLGYEVRIVPAKSQDVTDGGLALEPVRSVPHARPELTGVVPTDQPQPVARLVLGYLLLLGEHLDSVDPVLSVVEHQPADQGAECSGG